VIPVAIAGANGRMGRLLVEHCLQADDVKLVGALEHAGSPELGSDAGALVGRPCGVRIVSDVGQAVGAARVVIDFSTASATAGVVRAAAERGVACVVGTTGLAQEAREALEEASRKVPLLAAPNMSLGVQVLGHLLREALKLLGESYDVEVLEAHHRDKRDAPSGTALRLVELAANARGLDPEGDVRHGRVGPAARRTRREIGLHAVRGGDIVGDHTVILAGDGERVELVHRATSRSVFAAGALRAARWLVGRPPGRYTMADVVGVSG
jgi:4-hydroxy-tetrahydrodipicolinate reductase